MRKIYIPALIGVLLLGLIASSTIGQTATRTTTQIAGNYIFTQPVQSGGSIQYNLLLANSGRATLVSREVGNITVNRHNLSNYGDILTNLNRYHTVTHTGTWRQRGNNVEINLDTLHLGSQVKSDRSHFVGTLQRGDLNIHSYDRTLYGSSTRFVFVKQSTPGGGGSGPSANLAGTYKFSVYDRESRSGINYTLTLNKDGRATLVSDRRGNLPNTREFIDRYGRIVTVVDRYGHATQTGTWTVRNSRVIINLDTLRYDSRVEHENVRLRGTFSHNMIDINRSDTNLFGTATVFRFTR